MLSDMSPIRHLEWENLPDPMIISQIHFERSAYTFDEDAVIEIKRSDEFKLKAKLRGWTDNVGGDCGEHRESGSHMDAQV